MEGTKRVRQAVCQEVTLRDGRILAFAEHGNPAGQPIIYCHGVPSSRVEGDLILDVRGILDDQVRQGESRCGLT